MPDVTLHTAKWSDTEELRVGINEYKDKKYFALRIWYFDAASNQYRPGKQGINVPLDRADEFFGALDAGRAALAKQGKKKGAGK